MKASVVSLLFGSLIVIILPRGNEGLKLKKYVNREENFKEYDLDNNGYISLNEFRITGPRKGLGEHIELLIKVYDKNKDKQLSFEEFQSD